MPPSLHRRSTRGINIPRSVSAGRQSGVRLVTQAAALGRNTFKFPAEKRMIVDESRDSAQRDGDPAGTGPSSGDSASGCVRTGSNGPRLILTGIAQGGWIGATTLVCRGQRQTPR